MALFLAVARNDRERAARHVRKLLDLDPLSMNSGFTAGWLYLFCREYGRAAEQARSTLEMYPHCLHARYVLGWTALAEERYDDAIAAFEKAASLSRDAVSIAYPAVAYGCAGKRNDARELLRELEEKRSNEDVPEFLFAMVHDALGDRDAALESLERCLAARDSRIFWFARQPIAGSLNEDPRFEDLVRRVYLAIETSGRGAAVSREVTRA